MRSRFPFVLAASALVSLTGACSKKGGSEETSRAIFGDLANDTPDLAPYLALAHATVSDDARPDVPPGPPRRVFVTVYGRGKPRVATALGSSLAASIVTASEAVKNGLPRGIRPVRVKLDVVRQVEAAPLEPEMRVRPSEAGMFGYWFGDAQHGGFVLPSEMLTERYVDVATTENGTYRIRRDRIVEGLRERSGASERDLVQGAGYRIKTDARIDSSPPASALTVVRAHLQRPATLTVPDLLEAVRAGAEYLVRMVGPNNRFVYVYRPFDDSMGEGYSLLRHAGATYALLEAYGELGNPTYRSKAEATLSEVKARLHTSDAGQYLGDASDEEQQKSGGAGLALVAFAKHAEVTGSKANLDTMRSLGRFILKQQYPDGHFRANEDIEREDPTKRGKLKREVIYFAGEAILGLTRLYAIDPQSQWLDAALRGVDYLIRVRDANANESTIPHDHWLSYAMADLARLAPRAEHEEHAHKIARAIIHGRKIADDAAAVDLEDAYYDAGETTPVSTRLEALAADLEMARALHHDEGWLRAPAMDLARFVRMQQLDEQNAFYAVAPARAIGGVRESLVNDDVRIDYVQHAMSAWLHLARILRDPAYGTPEAADAGPHHDGGAPASASVAKHSDKRPPGPAGSAK